MSARVYFMKTVNDCKERCVYCLQCLLGHPVVKDKLTEIYPNSVNSTQAINI